MLKQLTPWEILLLIAEGTHIELLGGSGEALAKLYKDDYQFYKTDPKRPLYRAIKWN